MKQIILLICLTAGACMSSAQTNEIIPDRPGQSLTPYTVSKNWFQFETGLSKSVEKVDLLTKEKIYRHPKLVAKYGLVKNLELRLITDYTTIKFTPGNQTYIENGIENFQAGAKYNFLKEKGLRPAVSLVAHYDFGRLRTIHKDTLDGANFRFAMIHKVSTAFDVNYNVGMQWRYFGRPHQYIYTLSPKIHFDKNWHAFIEVYGFIENDYSPEHYIDGGVSYFLNDRIMLDLSAGLSITKDRAIKFFGVGFSYGFNTGKN